MKKNMHIKVVLYVRTSTNDQESGLKTQQEVTKKKIEDLGYRNIVETFIDENVPSDSYIEDRPAFQEMIGFIKSYNQSNSYKPIRELWCHTRDRISRDVDILGYATIILRKLDVEIIATNDEAKLINRIQDMVGEEELHKNREKRKQGIDRRLSEEKVSSRVPLGYKADNGYMIVDEELRLMIVEIFKMFDEDIQMSKISTKFRIPRSTLSYMRRNPVYRTGEYVWKGKVVYKVEPIIT